MGQKGEYRHWAVWLSGLLVLSMIQTAFVNGQTPRRILHFSPDYCIGQICITDESVQPEIRGTQFWNKADWTYLASARGDVTIPAGHRVKLILTEQVWEKPQCARDVIKLDPDAIDALELRPAKPSTPSDWLTPYIASLTELKELSLSTVTLSNKGLKPLSKYTQLQLLYSPQGLTNGGLKEITTIKTLRTLYLSNNQITDKALMLLKDLPELEELSLSGEKLTDQALPYLAQLPKLKHLYLSGQFSNGAMAHLKKCANLTILQLHIETFDDKGVRHISEIPNLERFSAHYMKNITDEGVRYLKNAPNLKVLDIKHAALTEQGLSILGTMTSLEHLDLPDNCTDADVKMLSPLKNLKYLWVGNHSNSMLSDESMKIVSGFSQLQELHISGKAITDEGVSDLSHLKHLTRLSISWTSMTDKSLEIIAGLNTLENVSLDPEQPFTTDGLNHLNRLANLRILSCRTAKKGSQPLNLSGLKKLEHLYLLMHQDYKQKDQRHRYYSLLTDEDVTCFKNLNQINFLCIAGAAISDEGFKTIAGLPKLFSLQLIGPTRMTDQAFAAFPPDSPIGLIRLNEGHFTGACLEHLAKLENLGTLELTSDVAFDNKSINDFKKNTRLYHLELMP